MALLEVDNLNVRFDTHEGVVHAVNDLSFSLEEGGALGIVGESGSGKSQTAFALLGLLEANGTASGSISFAGRSLLNMSEAELNRVRGVEIAMVFQDSMTSLNPYLSVGTQLTEVLKLHKGMDGAAARAEAIRMLDAVHIADPARRLGMYPHEFSGGMRQRVVIAMALLCRPRLIIADEPTTALDVTVQAQILRLLKELQRDFGTAIMLISHDLGVVGGVTDQVLVMYGGMMVESGPTAEIFAAPSHPYTLGLLRSIPSLQESAETAETGKLPVIPGSPTNQLLRPTGCVFVHRCAYRDQECLAPPPTEVLGSRCRACHRSPAEVAAGPWGEQ